MPRSGNPGDITVGTGLAPKDSIEANALVHPTGGNDGLRVHIDDPSRAHMAAAIGVEDVAANFASDEVEGALAELAGSASAGRNNGLIEGGLFTSSVGLTFELDATTRVLHNGTDFDATGLTVALTPSVTQYVYLDATTTLVTSLTPPGLASEGILFAEVTTDGVGITGSRDGRFFILNLDRKLPYTVRTTGADLNQRSEACFITFTAALLWLELYAAGGSTDPTEKHRLLVRGETLVSTDIVLPSVAGIIIEGEGDAVFRTGGINLYVLDASSTTRLTVRNISFVADHSGCTGILSAGNDLVVEDCQFLSGLGTWNRGVDAAGDRLRINRARIQAFDYGIRFENVSNSAITDCTLEGTAGTGTAGIGLNDAIVPAAGVGRTVVRGTFIDGWSSGISARGDEYAITDCILLNSTIGIEMGRDGLGATNRGRTSITNCKITLDPVTGDKGISADDSDSLKIDNCDIINPRTVWTTEYARGIEIMGGGSNNASISNCHIEGFYNSNNDNGEGIYITDDRARVSNCTIRLSSTGILTASSSSEIKVSGCLVREVEIGYSMVGARHVLEGCQAFLDSVRGRIGVFSASANDFRISNCYMENTKAPAAYTGAETPLGYYVQGARTQITGCTAYNFYNSVNSVGRGFYVAGAAGGLMVTGCISRDCFTGFQTVTEDGFYSNIQATGCASALILEANVQTVQGGFIDLDATIGLEAIVIGGNDIRISGMEIKTSKNPASYAALAVPKGVTFTGTGFTRFNITNCRFLNFTNNTDQLGMAVDVNGADHLTVENCHTQNCWQGVVSEDTAHSNLRVRNSYFSTAREGVRLSDATGVVTDKVVITGNTFVSALSAPVQVTITGYTDWEFTGNTLDGQDATTVAGLIVTGVAAANQRVNRFTISNNTFKGFGAAGTISALGAVENGTIDGNTIDGWIGTGVQVVATGILISEQGGDAPAHIALSTNTIYNCIDGISIVGTETVQTRRCTVDGNVIHHIANPAAPNNNSYVGAGAKPIGAYFAADLVLANNQIDAVGVMINDDNTTYTPVVVHYSCHGILTLNCQRVNASGNNIRSLVPGGSGVARGIASRQRGNTAGLITEGLTIGSNNVMDPTNVMDAMILVEVDDNLAVGGQTLNTVSVDGNTLVNGIYGIRINMGDTSAIRGLSISDNSLYSPSFAGIDIDALGEDCALFDVGINNNAVANSGGAGIAVNVANTTPAHSAAVTNVTVSDNTVSDSASTAIFVAAVGVDSVITNLVVNGNSVEDANGAFPFGNGISVGTGVSGDAQIINAVVTNNSIRNTTENGIYIVNAQGDVSPPTGGYFPGLNVSNNSIELTGAAGIRMDCVVNGLIQNAGICGNTIGRTSGNGITIAAFDGDLNTLKVNNNSIHTPTLNGIAVSVGNGTVTGIQVNGNTVNTPGVKGGATSQGVGVFFVGGSGTINDAQVNDNIILQAGTTGIAIGGVEIVIQATSTITCANVLAPNTATIAGITLTAGSTQTSGGLDFDRTGTNVQTADSLRDAINDSGNGLNGTVTAASNAGVVTITAVAVGVAGNGIAVSTSNGVRLATTGATAGGAGSTDASNNLRTQICRNLVTEPGLVGILGLTYGGDLTEWVVSQNRISRPGLGGPVATALRGGGILIGVVSAVGTTFENFTLVGNAINYDAGDTGGNSGYGIGFLGVGVNINRVMISDCTVVGSPATGIFVGLVSNVPGEGRLTQVEINDCNAYCAATADNAASYPHFGASVQILNSDPGGVHREIAFRGNKLNSASLLATSGALSLLSLPFGSADGGKFRNVQVSDNILTSSYSGFVWGTYVGSGGIYSGFRPIMDNITVTGNTVREMTGFGIASFMGANSSGTGTNDRRIENVSITNNQLHECATAGITNNAIVLDWPLPCINIRVDGNTILESGGVTPNPVSPGNILAITAILGVHIGEGVSSEQGVQGLSVCGNIIHKSIGNAILVQGSLLSFFKAVDSQWQNVHICDNEVKDVTEGGITFYPIYLGSGTTVENIHIDRNSVINTDGTDYNSPGLGIFCNLLTGITANGAKGRNVTMDNNTVRDTAGDGIGCAVAGFVNLSVSGNQVYVTGDAGIRFYTQLNTSVGYDLRVCDNNIYDAATQGINVGLFNGSNAENIAVCGNNIHNTAGHGIGVFSPGAANLRNLSISRNQVTDWDDDIGSDNGIRFDMNNPCYNVSICENNLLHTGGASPGQAIRCDLNSSVTDALYNFQCNGNNHSGVPGNGGPQSFVFNFNCKARSVSISGNTSTNAGSAWVIDTGSGQTYGLTMQGNIGVFNGLLGLFSVVIDGGTPDAPWLGDETSSDWDFTIITDNQCSSAVGGLSWEAAIAAKGGTKEGVGHNISGVLP